MKIYLSKGYGMSANLKLTPYKIQKLVPDEHLPLPPGIQSYTLRILGEADESVDINGSLPELEELVRMMAKIMETDDGSK